MENTLKRPQTITKEEHKLDELLFTSGVSGNVTGFQIYGTLPEMSYEDRNVLFVMNDQIAHLLAEDAIELGQKLIEHGTKALKANMYQHHHIHRNNELRGYIRNGLVEKVIFTSKNEKIINYGDGWMLYDVSVVWTDKAKEKNHDENFLLETAVFWSPDEEEYKQQISHWGVPVEIIGYDREADLEKFAELLKQAEEEALVGVEERVDNIAYSLGLEEESQQDGVIIDMEVTEDTPLTYDSIAPSMGLQSESEIMDNIKQTLKSDELREQSGIIDTDLTKDTPEK